MTSIDLTLPSSREEGGQQQDGTAENIRLSSTEAIDAYWARIVELSRFLPDYEILRPSSFYWEGARLAVIDSNDTPGPTKFSRTQSVGHPAAIYELLVGDLENASSRVIIAEDLNWPLCLALGAAFSLNPEFFIEHLHRQVPEYAGIKGLYMGEWPTWNVEKPYMSARWYRPATRKHDVLPSARSRRDVEQMVSSIKEMPRNQGDAGNTPWHVKVLRSAYNILRSEWDLSVSSNLTSTGLAAIEERVSIYRTSLEGCEIVVMLVDPLPTKSEAEWTAPYREEPEAPYAPPRTAEVRKSNSLMYNGLVPRYPPDIAYDQIIPRVMRSHYDVAPATIMSLDDFFQFNVLANLNFPLPFRSLPFWFMFRIIAIDTLGLLHLLENVLGATVSSMAEGSLDIDYLLRQRALVTQLQSQLPALNRSILASLTKLQGNVLSSPGVLMPDIAGSPDPTIDEVQERFANTIKRLEETTAVLTGNLQFVESHRGISEAENVTRLTELAFFFIPLSFAASAFSMQIKELSEPVGVWVAITFGFSLCGFSYLLRLVVRSSILRRHKNSLMRKVREHSDIPSSSSIPTTAFIAWLYAKIGPPFTFVMCLVSILAPILGVLWTRDMSNGLKAAVTAILIVFVILLSGMVLGVSAIRKFVFHGLDSSWYKGTKVDDEGAVPQKGEEQSSVAQGKRRQLMERVFAPYIAKPQREAP
ncbi:hypothetical protein FQN54_000105 [Arachnomyces sp. PD_36]|nr:hypothetical protein FQN54_000105 [Arachnomyces sp. PD_36]